MTTPAVPVVHNIMGLRKGWPELVFVRITYRGRWGRYGAWRPPGRSEDYIDGATAPTAAEAAQALAAALVAAGWLAKEEPKA